MTQNADNDRAFEKVFDYHEEVLIPPPPSAGRKSIYFCRLIATADIFREEVDRVETDRYSLAT